MIDLRGIPERVMFDSSVLTRTREDSKVEHSEVCRELWAELIKRQHRILIPTIALAEYMHHSPHNQPKRHRNIEIVAFDEQAASVLATQLPKQVFLKQQTDGGATKTVVKYDALILASAIRHRAGMLFCMDDRLCNLAVAVKMPVRRPTDIPRQWQQPASSGGSTIP